ncbi:MAG: hypothetical protein ACK5KM_05325, partial [Hyphomicrobiaceae bacterium]
MFDIIEQQTNINSKKKRWINFWLSSVAAVALPIAHGTFGFRVRRRSWDFIRSAARRSETRAGHLSRRLVFKSRRRVRRMIASCNRRDVAATQGARGAARIKRPIGSTLGLMPLEPRIVFDAAVAVTAEVAADQVAQQQAETAVAAEQPVAADTHEVGGFDASYADFVAHADADATEGLQEIAFIDGSVENVSGLIAGLPS